MQGEGCNWSNCQVCHGPGLEPSGRLPDDPKQLRRMAHLDMQAKTRKSPVIFALPNAQFAVLRILHENQNINTTEVLGHPSAKALPGEQLSPEMVQVPLAEKPKLESPC